MLIMDHIKNQRDDQKLPGESWKQKENNQKAKEIGKK